MRTFTETGRIGQATRVGIEVDPARAKMLGGDPVWAGAAYFDHKEGKSPPFRMEEEMIININNRFKQISPEERLVLGENVSKGELKGKDIMLLGNMAHLIDAQLPDKDMFRESMGEAQDEALNPRRRKKAAKKKTKRAKKKAKRRRRR